MLILVLCATYRGYVFLGKLKQLLPDAQLLVVSFPEDPWEPAYLEKIRNLTFELGGEFIETKQVGSEKLRDLWRSRDIDLIFAVNWRYMIPPNIYRDARLGSFVFHDSLLPEYRG